jgi:hypothetical protein
MQLGFQYHSYSPVVFFLQSLFHLLMLFALIFSVPRNSYVFPCSSSCYSLLKWSIKFCEWTNFQLLIRSFLSFLSPNSTWIFSLIFPTICICFGILPFFNLSASNHPCQKMWYFWFCCVFFISCIQIVQRICKGVKLMQNISGAMSLPEIFQIVFINLLFLLSSLLFVCAYLSFSNSLLS